MDNLLDLYMERIQAWRKTTARVSYSAIDPKRNAVALYDTLTQLEADRDEYRNLYHMGEAKISSREAIIEQLSEGELAKDVTRLKAENEALLKAIRHEHTLEGSNKCLKAKTGVRCQICALLKGSR